MKTNNKVLILGAGPAGLSCAYELVRHGFEVTVIEKNAVVGGLCRTLQYEDYLFDIGGHRFLSKSPEVNQFWDEILPEDFLRVSRKSRIFYQNKFFSYPLRIGNAMSGLGMWESVQCVWSFIRTQIFKPENPSSFEGWMTQRFGQRLYEIFFKSYTEKVWGIPCSDISSDWADQRIQGLSLISAIRQAVSWSKESRHKSLTQEFLYPRLGPGLFYERLKEKNESLGVRHLLNTRVETVRYDHNRITEIDISSAQGTLETLPCDYLFSSIPLTHLVHRMDPQVPPGILEASERLQFRSFITVFLIFDQEKMFEDNWIYVHSSDVGVARIQNYKNWSPQMVPDPQKTSLGMEYFVTQGDELWNMSDEAMIELALKELTQIGFCRGATLIKGHVFRVANAYPVYSPGYRETVAEIKGFLSSIQNLQVLGRAGLFRYNNSDHAILTGFYGARNLMGGRHDLWNLDI
ncbi:MAG: NAD(P)/FAD-dependent oxidoreductase [Candidatus Omnitrophica bacterium]|nr:NAD(P)/FAD-dependent oxidoreductase [Candidatus Omnitrophota bacterium]